VTTPQDVPTSPALAQVVRVDAPRSNLDWVAALGVPGPAHEQALRDLHALMVRAARHQVWRMRSLVPGIGAGALDELANGAADDALVALLAKLGTFEGRSRFTTWAYKFAVLEAAVQVRRQAWRGREVSFEDVTVVLGVRGEDCVGPAEELEALDLAAALGRAMSEVLTPYQRRIAIALLVDEVPIDVLAQRLATTRGALYKTLHVVRSRLRAALADSGHLPARADAGRTHGDPADSTRPVEEVSS
jgi:RNA polymerase sigma-70 factor (ECF subfamily)